MLILARYTLAAAVRKAVTSLSRRGWLPYTVNLCAMLLLTASMAQWTWPLLKPSSAQIDKNAGAGADTAAQAFERETLPSARLFGQPASDQNLLSEPVDEPQPSDLDLVLSGLVASNTGGYALISVDGQPQELFSVGEELTKGVILAAVYRDRTILLHNDTREVLSLEWPAKVAGASATGVAAAPETAPGVRRLNKHNFVIAHDVVSERSANAQQLWREALVVPYPEGGFLIQEIGPDSLYEALGLRVGDVIRSVNGQTINNAHDAVAWYQQIGDVSEVQLEILREGTVKNLYYWIDEDVG